MRWIDVVMKWKRNGGRRKVRQSNVKAEKEIDKIEMNVLGKELFKGFALKTFTS